MKNCPSDWVVVSPSRIGYGKTNFTVFDKKEQSIIDFYFGRDKLVNKYPFDISNVTHLSQIVELDKQGGNAKYPSLTFILNTNALMMMDLMNHLFGKDCKFSVIAVSGGGPFGLEMAKRFPDRIVSLQMVVPVGRNLIIGRGESPKKISELITLVNEKQETGEEYIFEKNTSELSDLNKKILAIDVNEPKPFNTTIALMSYTMDPNIFLKDTPIFIKFMSYAVVRLMRILPDTMLKMSVVNTEPEMLDHKCFDAMKKSFEKYQLHDGLEFNIATMYAKSDGYILDFLLFLQLPKNRRNYMKSITVPTLIQGSIFDKAVDFEDQVVYSFQNIPNSKLITYGDCGQLFFVNHLDKVFNYIGKFVDEISNPTSH